ncbi:penicillin-binding protein 1C [Vandammella animalimorsus]|uniref:penicillin-binding protein 1C n=1 Tax=Vandammella animalimorsus TaxID=2029117 RepID=UPI00325A8BC5
MPSSAWPSPQRSKRYLRSWRGAARRLLASGLLLAGLALAGASAPALADGLPSFDKVRQEFHSSETWLLDRHGQRLQRLRTDFSVRRGDWVALQAVSPALLHAIVLTEDKRFYEHSGVDWAAVGAAAWGNLWNERTRGASTITMQLAGLLNEALRSRPGGRSWGQKWRQLWSARDLEQDWSKAQVLEAYLNLVPFRGELQGIDALSRSLFDKAPHGLDQREAAIAAALLRAPNAPVARVAERACLALQAAQSPWGRDCKALAFYTEAALRRRHFEPEQGDAPHFARYALQQYHEQQTQQGPQPEQALPAELPSSLDAGLQRHAAHTLRRQLQQLQHQNVRDGAVLVLDNASGEVLAWVGSSGAQLSQAAEVDAVQALRQPGSTLKPFLYAQAIAQRRLTAASLLDDSPTRIPTAFGLYAPENYDLRYRGWVSVRQALGSSLNIPAVRTLGMVTPDAFAQQLRALGFALPEPAGFYGHSLALGGVDVSLLQLTNAYRTLANGGLHGAVRSARAPAHALRPADAPQRIWDERVAFIVGDMLSDRHARLLTFGTDSALATRFWSAVKTGTSKDMRDNWAIGYTPRFTIGVWVGNADGSPMHDVSGISGAAPVWASVAAYLHARHPAAAPQPPADLVRLGVQYQPESPDAPPPIDSSRQEWFLPGTEQAIFTLPAPTASGHAASDSAGHATAARIIEPQPGTIIALDPDIPPANQMLRLQTQAAQAQWWFNGQRVTGLADARRWYWPPMPGQHHIELRSADGRTVYDQVHIEVRGAWLKTDAP